MDANRSDAFVSVGAVLCCGFNQQIVCTDVRRTAGRGAVYHDGKFSARQKRPNQVDVFDRNDRFFRNAHGGSLA